MIGAVTNNLSSCLYFLTMQKEDLSYLAHELKSPLNFIMGFSSLLLQRQQQINQGKDTTLNLQLTEKVITNSKQLLRLINDTRPLAVRPESCTL